VVILRGGVPTDELHAAVGALRTDHADRLDGSFGVHEDVYEACFTARIDCAVAGLFGDLPHRRHEIVYKGRPVTPDEEWVNHGRHVDSHYVTMLPDTWAVSAFVFLNDVPAQCGALCVEAGSPRRHRRTMRRGYLHHLMEEWGGDSSLEELVVQAGDVALFQFNLAHASSTNRLGTQARMALDARYSALERVVPYTAMTRRSTVARATAMEDVLDTEPRPVLGAAAGGAPATAQVLLRHDGLTWRLFAPTSASARIDVEVTDDFLTWETRAPLTVDGNDPITSLHLLERWGGALVQVTRAGPDGPALAVYESKDLLSLTNVLDLGAPDLLGAAIFWTSEPMGAGEAGTSTLFVSDGPAVHWRSADSWSGLAEPRSTGASATLPADTEGVITDVLVGPIVSDKELGLVADVTTVDGESGPWYVRGGTLPGLDGELRPLPCVTSGAPHALRLYDRSSWYWLVTYLEADGAPHWGVIDWAESQPTLRELTTREAMADALRTVGYH
jgi:hypothetical protein